MGLVNMTYDDWFDLYRPIKNGFDNSAGYDGCLFETYGDELAVVQDANPNCVWTLVETDGVLYVAEGFHIVNRLGYFITTKPRENDDEFEIHIED